MNNLNDLDKIRTSQLKEKENKQPISPSSNNKRSISKSKIAMKKKIHIVKRNLTIEK